MSATPGKVAVDGIVENAEGRFFQLRMVQARDPALVGRPFLAHYDADAAWLDELRLDRSAPADIARAIAGPAWPGEPELFGTRAAAPVGSKA